MHAAEATGRRSVAARNARKPYVPTNVRTCPLGKLDPPSGAATTRRSVPATGRARRMNRLTTSETSAVPQASAWNNASIRRPAAASPAMIVGGMIRLWGGKPGHDAAVIRLSRARLRDAWMRSVRAASNAAVLLRRTRTKSAPKPMRPATAASVGMRLRTRAARGGTTTAATGAGGATSVVAASAASPKRDRPPVRAPRAGRCRGACSIGSDGHGLHRRLTPAACVAANSAIVIPVALQRPRSRTGNGGINVDPRSLNVRQRPVYASPSSDKFVVSNAQTWRANDRCHATSEERSCRRAGQATRSR